MMTGKRVWFEAADIKQHIAQHHPGCPNKIKKQIVERIISRSWENATLGLAVGLTIQNHLRHQMTEYDALLTAGMDRPEARMMVMPAVYDIIQAWGPKSREIEEKKEAHAI